MTLCLSYIIERSTTTASVGSSVFFYLYKQRHDFEGDQLAFFITKQIDISLPLILLFCLGGPGARSRANLRGRR